MNGVVEVIKTIKNYRELDSMKNNQYQLVYSDTGIPLIRIIRGNSYSGYTSKDYMLTLFLDTLPKEYVLARLREFGFTVTFYVPQPISDSLRNICRAYPDWWVAVDKSGMAHLFNVKPHREVDYWVAFNKQNPMNVKIVPILYIDIPFDWNHKPMQTNRLAEAGAI